MGVVTPMANEMATVVEFLDRVLAQLGTHDVVMPVLDRMSTDDTRALIEDYATRDERVRLIWAPENRCVVDAYFRGYREAMDLGCQWILEMDAGLSHCPEEIPLFIAAMEQGHDFAAGCRFMKGGAHIGSPSRYLLSRGGTLLTNLLCGTKMRDMTSGYECFNRTAMEAILKRGVRSRAHFFQSEIRFALRHHQWTEIPIQYRNPSASVGKQNIREALRELWCLRSEARATDRPEKTKAPNVARSMSSSAAIKPVKSTRTGPGVVL